MPLTIPPYCFGNFLAVASNALAKYSTLPSFNPATDILDVLAMYTCCSSAGE